MKLRQMKKTKPNCEIITEDAACTFIGMCVICVFLGCYPYTMLTGDSVLQRGDRGRGERRERWNPQDHNVYGEKAKDKAGRVQRRRCLQRVQKIGHLLICDR